MMANNKDIAIQQAIDAMREGRWEDIDPALIDDVEAYLNETADEESELANTQANGDLNLPETTANPNWDASWATIEQNLPARRVRPIWHRLSRVTGVLGLAAAITLMFTWQWMFPGANGGLALATSADSIIESVEVFDDSSSFIISAGEEEEISIIWIVEDEP